MSSLSGLTKSAGSAESKAFEATMLSAADETSQTSCGDFDEITGELMTAWRPAEAADEIGRLGGYRVLKALGVGGVFLAEDVQPNGD